MSNYLRGTNSRKFARDIFLTVTGIGLVSWLFKKKDND